MVVALDEFRHAGFNGGSVEHAMRAAVQHQRDVDTRVRRLRTEPHGADDRTAAPSTRRAVIRLEKIPADEFAASIDARFPRAGMRRARPGAAIVELAGNLPYDVQRLAHETWDDVRAAGGRRAGLDQLHATLSRLLAEQDTMFEAVWQRLTLTQRAVLRAVVLEEGRELLSADTRTRHRLGGPSSVQTALAALVRDDVVARESGRYVVVDSLLREWVARQTF